MYSNVDLEHGKTPGFEDFDFSEVDFYNAKSLPMDEI